MDVEFAYGYYYIQNYKIHKQNDLYKLKNPISGSYICSDKPDFPEHRSYYFTDSKGNSVIAHSKDKIFYCECLINLQHPNADDEDFILKYYENDYNRCLLQQLSTSVKNAFKLPWDFESPSILKTSMDSLCWFIIDKKKPIGYVAVKLYGEKANLYSIYVLPPFQKKGFGTKALDYVIEFILNEKIADKVQLIDPTIVTLNIMVKLGHLIKKENRYKLVNKDIGITRTRKKILPSPIVNDSGIKNPFGWEKRQFEDSKP